MNLFSRFVLICFAVAGLTAASAADAVYSGPQPGEKITPFKTLHFPKDSAPAPLHESDPHPSPLPSDGRGSRKGHPPVERDPIAAAAGKPTALVFVQAVERSLIPLLRVIDQYGAARSNLIKTEVVFLFADRLEGEQRLKAVLGSLKLKANAALSLDGAEGPGNYGLNKECLLTVLAAKDNKVESNFALVQPGIADGAKIIAALAKVCGDPHPPTQEQILAWSTPATAGRLEMARDKEMQNKDAKKEPFPGAVPTDPTLNSLMRQFIRPTNDEAAINNLRDQMKKHIGSDPALRQQGVDAWKRVLHFGDHYGTAYARKVGSEMQASLENELKATPEKK